MSCRGAFRTSARRDSTSVTDWSGRGAKPLQLVHALEQRYRSSLRWKWNPDGYPIARRAGRLACQEYLTVSPFYSPQLWIYLLNKESTAE